MGGQVRFHIEQWQEITSDPYVLQCVKNCHLELECEPSSSFNRHTNAQNFSFSEQQSIDNELNEFLSKQIIELSHHESGEIRVIDTEASCISLLFYLWASQVTLAFLPKC